MSDEPAPVDDRDLGGHGLDVADDMRRQDNDALARQVGEQAAEAHPLLGVEAGRGLVDDQQPRVVEQCLGDAYPLPHAAGEAAERPAAGRGEVHQLEQLVDAGAGAAPGKALDRRQVGEELAGAQVGIDAEVLRQVAELPAQLPRIAHDVMALPQHAPRGRPGHGGEDAHQRRLAGAVRTQQPEDARALIDAESA